MRFTSNFSRNIMYKKVNKDGNEEQVDENDKQNKTEEKQTQRRG